MTSTLTISINYMGWFFADYVMKYEKDKKSTLARTLKNIKEGKTSTSEREYDKIDDMVDDMAFSLRAADPVFVSALRRAIEKAQS